MHPLSTDTKKRKPQTQPRRKKLKVHVQATMAADVNGLESTKCCGQPTADFAAVQEESPADAFAYQLEALLASRRSVVRSINPDVDEGQLESHSMELANAPSNTEELLRMLSQSPHDTMRNRSSMGGVSQRAAITIVTRLWEEKFLHEASGAERPCANATSGTCFAGMIPSNGVVDYNLALTEFYTQDQYDAIRLDGWKWPPERRLCLLCRRQETFARLLACRCNGTHAPAGVSFSSIGNLVEKAGEYCVEDVFVSQPGRYEGVIVPVVIPCIGDYSVTSIGGIRYLKQCLPYPEHRQSAFFF